TRPAPVSTTRWPPPPARRASRPVMPLALHRAWRRYVPATVDREVRPKPRANFSRARTFPVQAHARGGGGAICFGGEAPALQAGIESAAQGLDCAPRGRRSRGFSMGISVVHPMWKRAFSCPTTKQDTNDYGRLRGGRG